jgi:hypothetical protein
MYNKKYEKKSGVLLLAAVLLAASCAGQHFGDLRPVYLTDKAAFSLLPPDSFAQNLDGAEQLIAKWGGKDYTLDAYVLANKQGLDMEFFSTMGNELGSLSYNGKSVSLDSAYLPKSIRLEYIVADFELIFSCTKFLAPALEAAGLRLETCKGSGITSRQIYDGNKMIIDIKKTPTEICYKNILRGYSYTLKGNFQSVNFQS